MLEERVGRAVYGYLRFSNNEAQGLAMVLNLVLGKQDLTKHLRAAFLGYIIGVCRQKGIAHWLTTSYPRISSKAAKQGSLGNAAKQCSKTLGLEDQGNSSIHQRELDTEEQKNGQHYGGTSGTEHHAQTVSPKHAQGVAQGILF